MDFRRAYIMVFLQKLMLMSQNRFLEGWGGAPQVCAGKKLFFTNQSKFIQKKFFDQAHPLPCEIDLSKMPILTIFGRKKSEFWNCCRNLCQKGTLSFKKDPASANKNHAELQVVPEHSTRPREQEKLLSA